MVPIVKARKKHVRTVCGASGEKGPLRYPGGPDCGTTPCGQDHARTEDGRSGRTYITLDDQTVLDAARADPRGFIRGLDRAVIDEIQRAPDLLLAIKKTVDEDYRPGRFLLTGSANVLTLPRVADSLAGRMETLRMLPLAHAEYRALTPTFLERLFAGALEGDMIGYRRRRSCSGLR